MKSNWKARLLQAGWIGSFIVLFGLMCQTVRGQSSLSNDMDEQRERIAILRSGVTVPGYINPSSGGYIIEQPERRVWYPSNEILYIVKDLHEGYQQLRNSVVNPTAATHMTLAEWCLSNRLYDEASEELKKCLKQDPQNKKANLLSKQVADVMRGNLPSPATKPARPMAADGFLQPEVESLGGLSRETAAQYTSKIQPLLINKCGNAACHGANSSHEFRLTGVRGGSVSRHNTERNLAAVMKYIDVQGVSHSPILSASKSGHGGRGPVFQDPGGAEQIRLLRTWTQNAAEEMKAHDAQLALRPTIKGPAKKSSRPTSSQEVIPAAYTSESTDSPTRNVPPPRELPTDDENEKVSSARPKPLVVLPHDGDSPPVQNEKPKPEPKTRDAFDPENFNRRFK